MNAPPHSIEAEQGVLGAVLLSEASLYGYTITERLTPEDFYRTQHRVIFEAMLEMHAGDTPIDVLTLTEHLRGTGKLEVAGGLAGIDDLAASVPAVGNLRRYGEIVRDNAILRRLQTATYTIQGAVSERRDPVRLIAENAERLVIDAAHGERSSDFVKAGAAIEDELDAWNTGSGSNIGAMTGFRDLDKLLGGLRPGSLSIVAARPSMGKSAWVTNVASYVAITAMERRPVALFSLEMSRSELAQRFISAETSIRADVLREGVKDSRKWERILAAAAAFDEAPLYIDDTSDIGLLEIRSKARRLHGREGLGLLIVDYLQLIRPDGKVDNRVEQVAQMSRGLKILARELEIPVVALSQLSRSVEGRGDKRPMLSDLRDSGALEQDADVVLFLYRDEYYNPDTTDTPGEAEVIVAKHRNGSLGEVKLDFQGEYTRFRDQ